MKTNFNMLALELANVAVQRIAETRGPVTSMEQIGLIGNGWNTMHQRGEKPQEGLSTTIVLYDGTKVRMTFDVTPPKGG